MEFTNLEHIELDEEMSIIQFINFNEYIIDDECDYDNIYEFISNEVKKLDLSNKHLTHLPLDIIMCEDLVELEISNNELTEVPAFLNKLRQLQKINVSKNEKIDSIEKIPDTIFELPKLERIILSGKYKDQEYNQNDLVKIREKRIKKIKEELRKIQENIVMKYLLFRKEGISNKDFEKSIKQDQEAFTKEYFLENLIRKLKIIHLKP